MRNAEILKTLSDEDLVGQVLSYDIYDYDDPQKVEKIIREIRPGAIYLSQMTYEKIKMYTDMANKYTKIPVSVMTDIEFGPGENLPDLPVMPNPMAWSACDDPELVEEAAELCAKISRLQGFSWTLSPVIDINMNFQNPLVNIRSASDSAEQVYRIMSAFLRGIQKNGYMAATLKHFPGDGVDDRNQHFCTTVNSLSMEEWRKTFGSVYERMISDGAASVMCAHIALPAYRNDSDEYGGIPCALSKPLMTDLLKGELGFDGCIISDAMSMVGSASRVDLDKLALSFLNCGGDMVLFNEPEDHALLLAALQSGELSRERLLDAADRVVTLKKNARLFEDQEKIIKEIGESKEVLIQKLNAVSEKIADRSIKFVRDFQHILPLSPKPDAKFLCVNLSDDPKLDPTPIAEELRKRGYTADISETAGHSELNRIMGNYDYVLVNYFIAGTHGGTMRIGWDKISVFWRGYVLKHPGLVVSFFGDPYKLYDFPFVKTCINTFSCQESSMRAFVRVLLGEKPMMAKNPVSLKGFFQRETR